MLRVPRRPSPAAAPPGTSCGITPADVDRAADNLLRAGERPTIERIRLRIGRGSPNTINPLLDAWWSRLASRLDAGPAALHRLPEPVLHAAEGLWLQALDDARRRAQLESGSSRKALARERQDLAVQSHVLSIRESELQDRLTKAERGIARLELELETLTTLPSKQQASRLAAERRLHAAHAPRLTPPRGRSKQNARKPVRTSPRAGVARRST
jgi:hypothetical protein